MSPRILNGIIILSMVGILLVAARDRYSPPKQEPVNTERVASEKQIESPEESSGDTPSSDPYVTCDNPYFNFTPQTSWKYHLSTGGDFVSSISKSTDHDVILETKLPGAKEAIESSLTCKKSGVYGLPFIPITSKTLPTSLIESILLIPNTKELTKGQTWKSSYSGVMITSVVERVEKESATVTATLDLGALPAQLSPVGNGKLLEYTLEKGIGITRLQLYTVTVKLVGYNTKKFTLSPT